MLIQALCDYYDILAVDGKILPEGYSNVNVHYLICLTEEGKVDRILSCQERIQSEIRPGRKKEKWIPRTEKMPKRTEKTGIESNVIEHRPLYIFGLNLESKSGRLMSEDATGKAQKSHEVFVKTNLEFLEGLESPLICAYRNFLETWKPESETENRELLALGKEYGKSGFAFCLTGYPDQLLHEERLVKSRWEERYRMQSAEEGETAVVSQCAVSGERAEIARIHSKIRGVSGGLATGSVLIGFNNPSENSYGNEQSYNSNVSRAVMERYTEALNFLLRSGRHKIVLDDITVVFWAMDAGETCENTLMAMLCGASDEMSAEETERMLKRMLEDAKRGTIVTNRLQFADKGEVDFYMLGLKPNSSRLSVKFIYRKSYAELLWNIARFQQDLQVSKEVRPVSIARIKKELCSPKNTTEQINPALLTKIFEAAIYGTHYPEAMLATTIRRIKADGEKSVTGVRIGMLKACLNRNYKKEEFDVALDETNCGQAYLCGRLFAVLEKLQQDAAGTRLNRTIRDTYIASAAAKPAIIFPKLLKLAQYHLNKVKSAVYYEKLLGEIMAGMEGAFPDTLLLQDQGRFFIGYYQQRQTFYEKKESANNVEMEEA